MSQPCKIHSPTFIAAQPKMSVVWLLTESTSTRRRASRTVWSRCKMLSSSQNVNLMFSDLFNLSETKVLELKVESPWRSEQYRGVCGCETTHLKSPLLLVTLSAGQYGADVSRTTISISWEVLPRELVTRHSQMPATPTSMLVRMTSLGKEIEGAKVWVVLVKLGYRINF